MKIPFLPVLLILVAAFAVLTAHEVKKDKKHAPVLQTVENAALTLSAPPLSRRESLEDKTKESLKDRVKTVYYYTSSYRKADYLVSYCEYKHEVRLKLGLERIKEKLKEKRFQYETGESKDKESESIYLDGTFDEKNGEKFGIKMRLEKRDKTRFWQIITVYPYGVKNEKAAEKFIKSVSFGSPEKKSA